MEIGDKGEQVAVLKAFFLFHCFPVSRSVFQLEEIMKYGNRGER
jgi:hypothetical protein